MTKKNPQYKYDWLKMPWSKNIWSPEYNKYVFLKVAKPIEWTNKKIIATHVWFAKHGACINDAFNGKLELCRTIVQLHYNMHFFRRKPDSEAKLLWLQTTVKQYNAEKIADNQAYLCLREIYTIEALLPLHFVKEKYRKILKFLNKQDIDNCMDFLYWLLKRNYLAYLKKHKQRAVNALDFRKNLAPNLWKDPKGNTNFTDHAPFKLKKKKKLEIIDLNNKENIEKIAQDDNNWFLSDELYIINFFRKFKGLFKGDSIKGSKAGIFDWNETIFSTITNFSFLIISALIIIVGMLLAVAYLILLERKVLGSIQRRRGPNTVGFIGLLQPIADAVKLIVKETIIPAYSNKIIFIIAPLLTLVLSLLNWSILPFSQNKIYADVGVSILMFFGISGLGVYGIIMSGWASNSKYAFLGALRAAAQVIAYEVSIGLTLICVIAFSRDLNYLVVKFHQIFLKNYIGLFFFNIIFFIACLAETNRPPFDLPEAEAELVSGYNVEYSAMTFGFFFLGEYLAMWTVCLLNIIFFWGGDYVILGYESLFILSLKVIFVLFVFIWVRGSLPRYRYDQLMRLGWKILLPLTLGLVILTIGFYFRYFFKPDKGL